VEKGFALLWAEILDHHLIVWRERTRATQELLDRELEILCFADVCAVGRHSPERKTTTRAVVDVAIAGAGFEPATFGL
jgi:hypothetical protein